MDELTNSWQKARAATAATPTAPPAAWLATAQRRQRGSLAFQYGNALVLVLTLVGVGLFFIYVAPLHTPLSHTGIFLMLGSLAVRIGTELRSITKGRRIQLGQAAAQTTRQTVAYYRFRQQVHGPVTLLTVGLYTLGFYALTPEFSHYLALRWVVAMDVFYLVGASLLIWQIRRGIHKELRQLAELAGLAQELESGF